MRDIRACGVLVLRGNPPHSFLLMRHASRWDLPKGHVDGNETDEECALRELCEETGIGGTEIELLPGFRFTTVYQVDSKRFGQPCRKTLVIFLARLLRDVSITPTEHPGYQWFPWHPPHQIQEQTIDPLLAEVERFMAEGK